MSRRSRVAEALPDDLADTSRALPPAAAVAPHVDERTPDKNSGNGTRADRAGNAATGAPTEGGVDPDRVSVSWRHAWLRVHDQASVVTVVAVCLAMMTAWRWFGDGVPGSWGDFDGAPGRRAVFQVDVNRATWPELSQLPGVGPTLAARWVAEREARGDFLTLSELERIEGIGPRTLDRIRPYLAPLVSRELAGESTGLGGALETTPRGARRGDAR